MIAILGVVLASGPELRVHTEASAGSRRTSVQPLLLACVAAAGFGLVFVALDHGARSSTVMTLLVMRAVSLVVLLAAAAATRISLRVVAGDLPVLAVIGVLDVSANAMFAIATHHGLLALVSVLSSLYPAVTAILAAVVHGERLGRGAAERCHRCDRRCRPDRIRCRWVSIISAGAQAAWTSRSLRRGASTTLKPTTMTVSQSRQIHSGQSTCPSTHGGCSTGRCARQVGQ